MKDIRIHPKTVALISSMVAVLVSGTVMFRRLEDWTWIESLYFTVVTTTTVGYGDLHPTTDTSRLVASIFILIGVIVLITAIGYIGSNILEGREEKLIKRIEDKEDNEA